MPPLIRNEFTHEGDFGVHVSRGQGQLEAVVGDAEIISGDDAKAILIQTLPAPLQIYAGAEGVPLCRDVRDPI